MSDYSSSEGSDDDYGPIATSWGDQTKTETEKPAGDWSSLENPNAKLGPSGLGSGDLHRKGRNYKPVDETLILQQRLKKASLKSEEEKAAACQQRRSSSSSSSRPKGRFSRPSSTSTRSHPRTTYSRPSSKPLRHSSSSSTTTPTTSTTTVYDYPRKPSLGESRQTAPWEEPPKPKKPSVRFSQPLECPTPPTMHSPKLTERPLAANNNPWANKPLMEEPFWAEPVKHKQQPEKPPPVETKRPVVVNRPTIIEEKLVEELEPLPSSHLELSTSTWSSGGVLTPSPVATPTKRADPALWDSPQTENWLDTFTPVETITPPGTISPPETKPSSPEIQHLSPASPIQQLGSTKNELHPVDSPVATPTASDSSWQSSTTNDTSVDDAWGASNVKAKDSWNTPSWDSPIADSSATATQSNTGSRGPFNGATAQSNTRSWNSSSDTPQAKSPESWNPASDTTQNSSTESWDPPPSNTAQTNTTDSWGSPSTTNKAQGWNKGSTSRGSTQANDTIPSWGDNSNTQSWNSNARGSTGSSTTNNNTWGSTDSDWNKDDSGWANGSAEWDNTTVSNWNPATTAPAAEEKKELSRFSRSNRPKYSTRSKGPLPANYNNKPLSPPTKVAPPSRVDNPVLVTVNVGLSDDKNIPVHIHLYDDPQALARQFARDNGIQSPKIIEAVHKLFANQKTMAMKKRSRPPVNTNHSHVRYNHHPQRNYSNV